MLNYNLANTLARVALIGGLFFMSSTSVVSGQETYTWNAVFADYQLDSVQGIRLETHYRTKDVFGGQQQFILRPSYVRKINSQLTLSGGYSFLNTEKQAVFLKEHNVWQQIFYTIPLKKSTFFGWLRAEERWVENTASEFDFGGRFRVRFGWRKPILGLGKKLEFMAFNEVFMFTKNLFPHTFNQNWTFLGFRALLSPKATLVSGYQRIHQDKQGAILEKNLWSSILFIRL